MSNTTQKQMRLEGSIRGDSETIDMRSTGATLYICQHSRMLRPARLPVEGRRVFGAISCLSLEGMRRKTEAGGYIQIGGYIQKMKRLERTA
jgi:hypothetical protein